MAFKVRQFKSEWEWELLCKKGPHTFLHTRELIMNRSSIIDNPLE